MPPIDSWRFVWQMQVETCQAAWEQLTLYWPGERARRWQQRCDERERMLECIRQSESALDNVRHLS